jgi:radical SAM protein
MFSYTRNDFDHSPMIVFYETTRACDLMCRHCRADAQTHCDPRELSTAAAKAMIEQLATFPRKPLLVLTGGDPIKRRDVFELIDHAVKTGLEVAMTPSATPLVTRETIVRLKEAGLHRLAVSLDGADAETHDGFRRVKGSFARTLEIIAQATEIGLPVQINTTVARHNVDQLNRIAELLSDFGICLWSVFFLVPTGRASLEQKIGPEEYEMVFRVLYDQSKKQKYAIKSTEAPHYRRFLLQQRKSAGGDTGGTARPNVVGTNDGKGVMFISHTGDISPSGFLPHVCGTFPRQSIVDVYQNHRLFKDLRDSEQLQGKCGLCEYKEVCGGSRARAHAMTGDPLGEEPDCVYVPQRMREQPQSFTGSMSQ